MYLGPKKSLDHLEIIPVFTFQSLVFFIRKPSFRVFLGTSGQDRSYRSDV